MHSFRLRAILPALLLALGPAHAAAFSMSPDMAACDGALAIDTTTDPGKVLLSCSGPLTLNDGTLMADREVIITAPSVMLLGELTLDAPTLGIVTDLVMAGSNAELTVRAAPRLTSSSPPSIASGAMISIAGEPAAPMTQLSSGGNIQLTSGTNIDVQQAKSTPSLTVVASTTSGSTGGGGGGSLDIGSLLGLCMGALAAMISARRRS